MNPKTLRQRLILRLLATGTEADLWFTRQLLAGPTGRFYGSGGTIHSSGHLDVDVVNGEVKAVWFRCMTLPFRVSKDRRDALPEMNPTDIAVTGVEYVDLGI